MEGSESKVPKLLTVKQLSAATGVPVWRLYDLIRKGEGPRMLRLGMTFRFPEDGVVAWINELCKKEGGTDGK